MIYSRIVRLRARAGHDSRDIGSFSTCDAACRLLDQPLSSCDTETYEERFGQKTG